MKTQKLAALPVLLAAVMVAAAFLAHARANSVGLYVSDCSGGGYSYYTSSPATIGTYELNGSIGCLRNTARSWLRAGTWENWSFVQSSSGIGSTCSAGAGNCGSW